MGQVIELANWTRERSVAGKQLSSTKLAEDPESQSERASTEMSEQYRFTTEHIGPEVLERFSLLQCGDDEEQAVEEHLLVCEECREALDECAAEIRDIRTACLLLKREEKGRVGAHRAPLLFFPGAVRS